MDMLAEREKKKYQTLWQNCSEYGDSSPADLLAPAFIDFFRDKLQKGDRIIDFGCGSGRSALPLQSAELHVCLVDICSNCLDPEIFLSTLRPGSTISFIEGCMWDLSSQVLPAEWILCFDVLEHIPEEKIDNVLHAMSLRMKTGGLISISLRDDHHGGSIGEKLHLTVKPAVWWHDRLSSYFSIYSKLSTDQDSLVWAISAL